MGRLLAPNFFQFPLMVGTHQLFLVLIYLVETHRFFQFPLMVGTHQLFNSSKKTSCLLTYSICNQFTCVNGFSFQICNISALHSSYNNTFYKVFLEEWVNTQNRKNANYSNRHTNTYTGKF